MMQKLSVSSCTSSFLAWMQHSSAGASLHLLPAGASTAGSLEPTRVNYEVISSSGDHARAEYINDMHGGFAVASLGTRMRCIALENTPYSVEQSAIYPLGATFATSQSSLTAAYADISSLNNSFSRLNISLPTACVGGSKVFGHFLLQCIPKLLLAKRLGLLGEFLFVFSDEINPFFLKFISYMGLLPPTYLLTPRLAAIETGNSFALPLTPIMSGVTLDSLAGRANFLARTNSYCRGYGLCLSAYRLMHDLVDQVAPTKSATLSLTDVRRVYITRKKGTHRDLRNREEIVDRALAANFLVVNIEDCDLDDQFFIFRNCELLIAEVGSSACNAWMMPNLKAGLELCIDSVYGAWGLLLASAVSNSKFYRLEGVKVPGSLKRWDGDSSKPPLETDYDYNIDVNLFAASLDRLISSGT